MLKLLKRLRRMFNRKQPKAYESAPFRPQSDEHGHVAGYGAVTTDYKNHDAVDAPQTIGTLNTSVLPYDSPSVKIQADKLSVSGLTDVPVIHEDGSVSGTANESQPKLEASDHTKTPISGELTGVNTPDPEEKLAATQPKPKPKIHRPSKKERELLGDFSTSTSKSKKPSTKKSPIKKTPLKKAKTEELKAKPVSTTVFRQSRAKKSR